MLRGAISHGLVGALYVLALPAGFGAESEPVSLRFDVATYQVEGNTLLKDKTVQAALAPFRGKQRDLSDVQQALKALELAYREAGYGAVQVYLPEQEIDRGIITLRVVEARIGKVEVTGNKYFDQANIRRSLPALQEGQTPNARKLADNLRLANDTPVKQAQVILRPSSQENAVDAKVEVEDHSPWRVFGTLDNTGSPQTGMTRAGIGLQYNNLFNRDQAVTAQYITSPTEAANVKIFALGYHAPLYSLGDSVDAYAGYSDVDAGTSITAAGPLAFSGQGTVAGGRYNQNLRRFGEYEHKVVYSLDYRLYDNVCSLVSFGGSCGGGASATVAVHPVGLSYAGQWAPPRRQLTFQVGVYQNIPGGSYGSEADFTQVNPAAKADYHLSREELNFVQALWRDFQARLVLYSQYTDDTLIPGEQFGLGGMNSVRGFLERAISNDKGYSGQAELYTPDFSPALKLGRSTLRALAFFDFGAAFANNPQPGQISATHISSAGAGLRYGYGNYVSLRADAAWVIHGDGLEPDGHFRADFALLVSF